MMHRLLCALALMGAVGSLHAEQLTDPLGWLGRIATAAQRLNYSGTFIYQSGGTMETSRIVHGVDTQGEFERLEVLDGSPRQVVRSNGEVRCLLPQERVVIIDQQGGQRPFPARLPVSFATLPENYVIRKGALGRVAGHEAQQLLLQPRDGLRFGHVLWADVSSGLLLKARIVDEQGGVIEQFSFSELHIGEQPERAALFASPSVEDWRVVDARGHEVGDGEVAWVARDVLPGYRRVSMVKRLFGGNREQAVHMMFSDGLANISVFIEPGVTGDSRGLVAEDNMGPLHVYERQLDGVRITVLGAVPYEALRRLGNGIERVH